MQARNEAREVCKLTPLAWDAILTSLSGADVTNLALSCTSLASDVRQQKPKLEQRKAAHEKALTREALVCIWALNTCGEELPRHMTTGVCPPYCVLDLAFAYSSKMRTGSLAYSRPRPSLYSACCDTG